MEILPKWYKTLYSIPFYVFVSLVYANIYLLPCLLPPNAIGITLMQVFRGTQNQTKACDEYEQPKPCPNSTKRHLLMITDTFTCHLSIRWPWYGVVLILFVIYAGLATRLFRQFFLMDGAFLRSLKQQTGITRPDKNILDMLIIATALWPAFLCGVVLLIHADCDNLKVLREELCGDPQKNHRKWMMDLHYILVFFTVVFKGLGNLMFLKLLQLTEDSYREKVHGYSYKSNLLTVYIIFCFLFGSSLVGSKIIRGGEVL